MADDKWASPSIPRKLYDQLDLYAKTEEGQNLGFNSGKDVLVDLMRKFVKEHTIKNSKKIKN